MWENDQLRESVVLALKLSEEQLLISEDGREYASDARNHAVEMLRNISVAAANDDAWHAKGHTVCNSIRFRFLLYTLYRELSIELL